ncbi:MAG: hypothetical protein A2287_00645 [Candidatus Melainabacteria bacterium RIFOXYA12_FULL_32_12]|nr:MAG: hypothetical protein A2287_00645 [Candidatus Melainabacteria bacterium RIFOXYA12_FULL_32_12]
MLQEAVHVNIKSFDLVSEITRQDLFSKIDIKPVGRLIIFNLANMYNPKLGYSFPGIDKLARCTGYSDRQVKTGLKELFEFGLIVRTEKKIYFTRKFYEILQLIQDEDTSQKSEEITPKSENISPPCHEQIKTKKLNNSVKNKVLDFRQKQQEGQNYISVENTRKYLSEQKSIKPSSPLDFNFKQAKKYLEELPEFLKDSYFAKELKKKWDL